MASVVPFWAVSMLFVLTPGADWAYAMAAGMQRGVFWSVTGMLTGHLLATLMVAAGLATLLASFPVVMAALTATGSLYLGWLGARTLRQRHDSAGDVAATTGTPPDRDPPPTAWPAPNTSGSATTRSRSGRTVTSNRVTSCRVPMGVGIPAQPKARTRGTTTSLSVARRRRSSSVTVNTA